MAAEIGNKYAEKWTKEKALEFFEASLELLNQDESILFLGTVAVKLNSYPYAYNYLIDKYSGCEVFVTIKNRIDAILEERQFVGALTNKLNPTMAIFSLKNNHGWEDKTKVDNTSSDGSMTPAKEITYVRGKRKGRNSSK